MSAGVVGATARRFAFWLAAIAAAGVALRLAQTLLVAPWPPELFNDEAYYATLGRLIADGEGFIRPAEFYADGLSLPTAERAPLFPLAVAVFATFGVVGDEARLIGLFTGGATIVLIGLLGRRLAGERAGLIAAAVAAVYPTLIAADGALMTESLYGALAAGALLAAYRLMEEPTARRAVILGAILAVAAHARAEALLLLPLILLPFLRPPGGLRAAAVVCAAFVVALLPWGVRNFAEFDRPVLIATEGGETLAGANCTPMYYGERIGSWSAVCVSFDGRGNEARELNEAGRDGIDFALDNTGQIPRVLAYRVARTWSLYGVFDSAEGREPWVTKLGLGMLVLLVPLGVYGLVTLRRRQVPVWILCTPLMTVTLTSLLAYGNPRFRHSAEIPIVVLAGVALDRLASRGREPSRTVSSPAAGSPA